MVRLSTEEKAALLIREWQAAYRAATEGATPPRIRYARGWFTLVAPEGETTKTRGSELREMTRRLRAARHPHRTCCGNETMEAAE